MVKKTSPRRSQVSKPVTNSLTPLINRLDFPFVPFLILSLAFVLLIFTLSPYLFNSLKARSKIIVCGGIAALPCPNNMTCVLDGYYPDASGTCRP